MSSFKEEPTHTSTPNPGSNAHFDSGLGSSINQLSGSFGEGYQPLLLDSYEAPEGEYDSLILDGGPGPLSLQPQSLPQLLTTDFNAFSSNDIQHELSGSTSESPADCSETGSTSTVASTHTNASVGPAVTYSNPTHNEVIASGEDGNYSEFPDTQQCTDDPPSPVLSHVRAEPLTVPVKEINIHLPVVEQRSEIISINVLAERGRSHSPP